MQLPVSLSQPYFLLLLLLIPAAFYIQQKSFVDLPQWRRRVAFILRAIIIALIVLALAGIKTVKGHRELSVLFALDCSTSINEAERERAVKVINNTIDQLRPVDAAGLLVFGEDALVESAPISSAPPIKEIQARTAGNLTNLARALRLAMALFPADKQKRLVVLTDGNENVGDALAELHNVKAENIVIDVVPLQPQVANEVLIESVNVPQEVDQDKPFNIKTVVWSNAPTEAKLIFFREGNLQGSQQVKLEPGKNIFIFQQREPEPGFHTYQVMVEAPLDSIADNNLSTGFTSIYGEAKALIAGKPEDTQYVVNALTAEGIKIEQTKFFPEEITQLQNYDGLLLVNVPGFDLTDDQLRMIKSYVSNLGGGFAMVGGENSFGPGGYINTPVEEILPVRLQLKSRKEFPSLALAMLIDKSGSMSETVDGGITKVALANEAAAAAVELLSSRDFVAVVAFDSAAKWVQELTPAIYKAAIINQIRSIRSGGGTDMYPALEMGIEVLTPLNVQLKHIIALSDGMTRPANYDQLLEQIEPAGITLSTVAVGPDADKEFMYYLSQKGKGRYYFTPDPTTIPRIFTRETVIAQRSYLVEQPFSPQLTQYSSIVKGLTAFPELKGYVATWPKELADLIITSHKDDPVLAAWQIGLGRSVAFTSDARSRWATAWLEWPGFNKFWAQLCRWMLRQRKPSPLHPSIKIKENKAELVVDAISPEGDFLNFLQLTAHVIKPDYTAFEVPLNQTGPGRYQASFEVSNVGIYLVGISGQEVEPATTGFTLPYAAEFSTIKPNTALMHQLAANTGGKFSPTPIEMATPLDTVVYTSSSVWYPLLIAALMLLILDIAVRRLFIELTYFALAWEKIKSMVTLPRARPIPVETTITSLKKRKEKARLARPYLQQPKIEIKPPVQESHRAEEVEKARLPEEKEEEPKPEEEVRKEKPAISLTERLLSAKKRFRTERKKKR